MEENGWIINADRDNSNCTEEQCSDIEDRCGADTFYGFMDRDGKIASVTATFKGSGRIMISFGNCGKDGKVLMGINGELKASAEGNRREEITNLPYSSGDVLEIYGYRGAIIKLYHFFFVQGE